MTVPKHASTHGRERRIFSVARLHGRLRDTIPMWLLLYTGLRVAGLQPEQGNLGHQALDVVRIAIVGALTAAGFLVVVLLPIRLWCDKLKEAQAGPRPRAQYLLISVSWLAAAWGLIFAGQHLASSYLARLFMACGLWFGLFGVAMAGRALGWGKFRRLFWWDRPSWMADRPGSGPGPAR